MPILSTTTYLANYIQHTYTNKPQQTLNYLATLQIMEYN